MQVNTSKSAAHQIQGTKFRACSGGKVPLKNTGPAAVGRRFGEWPRFTTQRKLFLG